MKNKDEMPDDIWLWFADNGNIRKWSKDSFIYGTKYHADYIVQRLEREKAELVEVLENLVEPRGCTHGFDAYLEDKLRELLQKHTDTK